MQPGSGIGAESDDIAGIRRYFRLIKDDIQHPDIMPYARQIMALRKSIGWMSIGVDARRQLDFAFAVHAA